MLALAYLYITLTVHYLKKKRIRLVNREINRDKIIANQQTFRYNIGPTVCCASNGELINNLFRVTLYNIYNKFNVYKPNPIFTSFNFFNKDNLIHLH